MTQGHSISVTPADLHVEISVNGVKVAESDRPVLLDETGLPTRYYLPREHVRADLLRPTNSETVCPFKGQASYWSATIDGEEHRDLAWAYDRPIEGMEGITGLVCFYAERVDTTVDGELLDRPESPWSKASA